MSFERFDGCDVVVFNCIVKLTPGILNYIEFWREGREIMHVKGSFLIKIRHHYLGLMPFSIILHQNPVVVFSLWTIRCSCFWRKVFLENSSIARGVEISFKEKQRGFVIPPQTWMALGWLSSSRVLRFLGSIQCARAPPPTSNVFSSEKRQNFQS